MNRENIEKLKDALYKKGFAFSDRLQKLTNGFFDLNPDLWQELKIVSRKLEPVLDDINRFVSTQQNQPQRSEMNAHQEHKEYNIEKGVARMSEDLIRLETIAEDLLNRCNDLESFVQESKSKGSSVSEIVEGLLAIKNNINTQCDPNLVLKAHGLRDKEIYNIRSNALKLADSYLSEYVSKLTPEEKKGIRSTIAIFPSSMPKEVSQLITESNDIIRETDMEIRGHSYESQDSSNGYNQNNNSNMDNLIDTVISDFDKLNNILDSSFDRGRFILDPYDLTRQIKSLEENFQSIYFTDKKSQENNEQSVQKNDPFLNFFIEKMTKRLSESTKKSISAIQDFIPESFERNIVNAKKLIETAEMGDSEKSALIKSIVKDSVIYMNSVNKKPSISKELEELLKKADELSYTEKAEESTETKTDVEKDNTTIEQVVEETINDVMPNPEITEEEKESIVEEVIEQVDLGVSESIDKNAETVEEIKSTAESVINQKIENITSVSENDTVIKKEVVEETISEINNISNIEPKTIVVETPSIDDAITDQQDISSQTTFQNELAQDLNTSQNHPLERYKLLIEKYDVQFVKDDRYPDGHFVVTERATGKVPEYIPPEQRPQLTKDLAFAKSWISSCATGLSTSGKVNEFGYDERVWEYAFNDGAMDTFTSIVDLLKNNTNPNLNTDMIINMVSSGSTYKYSSSIVQSLLRERDNPYILNNIHERLLAEAGFGHDISQVLDSDGMDMNN